MSRIPRTTSAVKDRPIDLDESPLRAKALRVLSDPTSYSWADGDDENHVLLHRLSDRDNIWHVYTLSDKDCGCPSTKPCYHREMLNCCGGVWHVRRQLRIKAMAPDAYARYIAEIGARRDREFA